MHYNYNSGDWKTLFSLEELISVEQKFIYRNSGRISFDKKYTERISVNHFIILEGRIYFCKKLTGLRLRIFLFILFLFRFWYELFLCNMKSKMQQKHVILYQYLGSISKYFRCIKIKADHSSAKLGWTIQLELSLATYNVDVKKIIIISIFQNCRDKTWKSENNSNTHGKLHSGQVARGPQVGKYTNITMVNIISNYMIVWSVI